MLRDNISLEDHSIYQGVQNSSVTDNQTSATSNSIQQNAETRGEGSVVYVGQKKLWTIATPENCTFKLDPKLFDEIEKSVEKGRQQIKLSGWGDEIRCCIAESNDCCVFPIKTYHWNKHHTGKTDNRFYTKPVNASLKIAHVGSPSICIGVKVNCFMLSMKGKFFMTSANLSVCL